MTTWDKCYIFRLERVLLLTQTVEINQAPQILLWNHCSISRPYHLIIQNEHFFTIIYWFWSLICHKMDFKIKQFNLYRICFRGQFAWFLHKSHPFITLIFFQYNNPISLGNTLGQLISSIYSSRWNNEEQIFFFSLHPWNNNTNKPLISVAKAMLSLLKLQ